MKFPEEYIEINEKRLHSGGSSKYFCNFEKLLTDTECLDEIYRKIPFNRHYVGIITGGGLMAMALHARNWLAGGRGKISFIKNGELWGHSPEDNWILIDDVTSTGNSLRQAIATIGKDPYLIYVGVDRRK